MFNIFKNNHKISVSTTISCGSCEAKVKPFLDEEPKIKSWTVNTKVPEKTLIVEGDITKEELNSLLNKAGYSIKE
jgi:copper chaperone